MDTIFKNARGLAQDLLETEIGKKYQEAKYIFEGDEEAMAIMQAYAKKAQEFQMKMQEGSEPTEEDQNEINNLVAKVKENAIITELFKAEGEFNQLFASVMDVFNATIMGESQEAKGSCGGGCGGCSGCN